MTEVEIITIGDEDEETPRPTSRPRKRRISHNSADDSDDDIILESDWRRRIPPGRSSDVRRGRYYRERPRHNIRDGEDDVVVPPPPSDWAMRQVSLSWDFRGGRDGDTTRQRRGTYPLGNSGDQALILLDHSPPSSPSPPSPHSPPSPPPSSSDRRTSQAQVSSDLRRRRKSNLTTERRNRVHRGERGEVIF